MNRLCRVLLVVPVLASLSACGVVGSINVCSDEDYKASDSLPPLSVPADLDPPQQVAGRKIPDEPENPPAPDQACLEEPPSTLSAQAQALAKESPKKSRKERKAIGSWPTDEDSLEDWLALDPDTPGVLGENLGTMHGIATKDVGDTLLGWAQAWSFRQLAPYFSYYSTNFEPEDGRKFKKWRRAREKELEEPGNVELSVYGMRARPVSQNRVQVRFFQRIKSDDVSQVIRKEILLIREEGGWAILRERSLGA